MQPEGHNGISSLFLQQFQFYVFIVTQNIYIVILASLLLNTDIRLPVTAIDEMAYCYYSYIILYLFFNCKLVLRSLLLRTC